MTGLTLTTPEKRKSISKLEGKTFTKVSLEKDQFFKLHLSNGTLY